MIHCQYADYSFVATVNFGRPLTFEPLLSCPFGMENPISIALVVGSGAPVCGLVTSALHKHGIMLCLVLHFPLSKLCDYVWKGSLKISACEMHSKGMHPATLL